jgi:putative DNA primase/helicase
MNIISAEEFERAVTWHSVIAGLIIPADTPFTDDGADRHWEEPSSLYVCRASGSYRWYARALFGRNTLKLIQALQQRMHGLTFTIAQAAVWLGDFLAQHTGTGPLEPGLAAGSETKRVANAAWAKEILAEAVDLDPDSDGGRYLDARGLPGPWPLRLQWLTNARPGEGAIVTPLTAHGRTTGVQLTYITPLATKSLVKPARMRLNIEPEPAFIEIASREPGVVDISADTILVEGVENGLSLSRLKRPGWRIIALPGITTLAQFTPERQGERVVVFQDSDPEGSSAREALQDGIDAIKLAGAAVRATVLCELGDANAILLHKKDGGEVELTRLLLTAAIAPLSFAREAERLAQLSRTEYEKARRRVAEVQGVRVSHLDREVSRLRAPAGDDDDIARLAKSAEDVPWSDPIPPLAAIFDTATKAMASFLIAPAAYYDIMTLWSAVSYLVQSEVIALPIMPQLAFQSEGPESGKSTALEIVATLCSRGILRSSYTGATLFRQINEQQVTYCLADLHTIMTDPRSEIHAVIKACHRRAEAFVDRTEEHSGGARYVATYRCWSALAWASIGPMTPEMHGRAIVLPLQPALPEESTGLDHTSPSRSSILIDARRQVTAWAAKVIELPTPAMPSTLWSRSADNWRPLLAVAELAGGDWPQRALAAIEAVRKVERRPDLRERLLTAIRDAFYAQARADAVREANKAGTPLSDDVINAITPKPDTRIATLDLLDALNNDEESGLGQANHGRGITAYWLRDHLRGLLNPPGSREWQEVIGTVRKHVRGYEWHQFAETIRRHLPSQKPVPPSGASGTPAPTSSSAEDLAEFSVPDAGLASGKPSGTTLPHSEAPETSGTDPGPRISREGALPEQVVPLVPDAPDAEVVDHKGGPGPGDDETAAESVPPATDENARESLHSAAEVPPSPAADPIASSPEIGATCALAVAATGASVTDGQSALSIPHPPIGNYEPGTIDAEIRRLREAYPHRSLTWLSKQTGQPKRYVQAVLGITGSGGEQP